VHHANDPARLKAKMLRAAVQDNFDTITDRVPTAFSPSRRFLALCLSRARVLLLPGSIAASILIAAWSIAAEPAAVPAPTNTPAPALTAAPAPPSPPDLSLLSRPLKASTLALAVRRVVLDAGHGGAQRGTASASGLQEKAITLDLAERARKLLVARGFEVVMTRTGDDTLSLRERATTANQHRGDIFVSIHLNSFARTSARGIETFYLGPSEHPDQDAKAAEENEHSGYSLADMRTLLDGIYVDARRDESQRLARAVQRAMMQRLRKTDPQLEDRGVKTAPFVVLVATAMPAILAEVSCLSNPDEAERLGTTAHRQAIAEALVSGIRSFTDQKMQSPGKRKETNE
jgi:N-acetylmuramoyl-L-alanine amidase